MFCAPRAFCSITPGLLREGFVFQNGDLNSYLRVVVSDPDVTLRSLVHSGRTAGFRQENARS